MISYIEKLRAITDAATAGEWHTDYFPSMDEWTVLRYGESPTEFAADICDPDTMTEADARFIAWARNVMPAMLDALAAAEDHVNAEPGSPMAEGLGRARFRERAARVREQMEANDG